MKKKEITKNSRDSKLDYRSKLRYRLSFALLRPLARLLAWLLFNYQAVPFDDQKEEAYFILSNHTGSLDPLLLALSFKKPIFFVASDHIFRLGWISRLLDYLVAPIPIVKSKLDLKALRTIYHELESGRTLALFPSGNRSIAGSEEAISPATAKLLKNLKMPVLLFRIEGGYLTSPRWAKHHRRGKMSGSVVLELTKEEIENYSLSQLNALLKDYLDADPYSLTEEGKIKYRGFRPAEHLERILYLCPVCKQLASLKSRNDLLMCSCGFSLRYQNSGYFVPASQAEKDLSWPQRFPNTKVFYKWQQSKLKEIISAAKLKEKASQSAFFADDNEVLTITQRARKNLQRLRGRVELYRDRLEYRDEQSGQLLSFPLESISDLTCIGPQRLQFTDSRDGQVYESQNKQVRSAYKYIDTIQELKRS